MTILHQHLVDAKQAANQAWNQSANAYVALNKCKEDTTDQALLDRIQSAQNQVAIAESSLQGAVQALEQLIADT